MVRHNYPNCTSCHVSNTGGGVLTQYGRELSAALLSHWGSESTTESTTAGRAEGDFAYGLIELPKSVDAMLSYRGVYAYVNTPFVQRGQYTYMQGDLEAAYHTPWLFFDATLGLRSGREGGLVSRRHYAGLQATEELSFRLGRFFPGFGINTADHLIPTKSNLGWDESREQESYNLEAAWIGEQYNLIATADFGRPDASEPNPNANHETGGGITGSRSFADHHKVGASYFYGDGSSTRRHLFGPWAILGFTPNFYLLSEWDLRREEAKSAGSSATWGGMNYQKLGYELTQGLHVYATQDYSRLDFKDPTSIKNSFGLGAQLFPRPHFELNFQWQKLKTVALSEDYTDLAWLMLNIYI